MKTWKYLLIALLVGTATHVDAKRIQTPHMYVFGFSASFQDSIIYMTDIQDLQGAWIDKKTKDLAGQDNYSLQLKNHMAEQLHLSPRVCMVFFSTSKKKAEKKYLKLRKLYVGTPKKPASYEVRYLSEQDFRFDVIDMSEEQQ